ncbi:endonuclease domain-containing protein [Corynebacterium aquatimens]|uniref:Very-short-patch-repair endonuclease n=1 Tax=Corynebacterium aquatimens TaxID=1190508 RepID=A0A931E3F5_9CORY|nr:DUF559 domain-containing protein [Corynebacterium aquatimens]MBG6123096.1 very-short-patch-repair endonuclease [Corynebacterium aquatimens]WJY66571.1 hypothetical protein CAQUA_09420 [Corynebacterium aquatimens]
MDYPRFQQLTDLIINYRALNPGVSPATHQRLSGYYGYPRSNYQALAYHEKKLLLAYTAGLASRRSILICRSAARIWNIWVVATTPETIEISLPRGNTSPSRAADPAYTYRFSRLPDRVITRVRGVAVTSAIRTFIDIARYHGFAEGLVALDCLLANGVNLEDIEAEVAAQGRFKGVATVRRCLHHCVPNSESPYESYARALLIEAGVDDIVAQFVIDGFRADLCLGGWLLVEIDGRSKYEGDDAQAQIYRDLQRERLIGNQGYVFLRFTPEFLLKHPDEFVRQVLERFAAGNRGSTAAN